VRRVPRDQALAMLPVLRPERTGECAIEPGAMDMDVHALHQGFLRGVKAAGGELVCRAEVVAISLGLWTPARPALTQDLIERFPEAIVGMQAWMGDDALGRLVLTAYPCLVGERTAAMTEQMLSRTDLTPGVRRALIDIGHRHEEAMRSLHRYAATQR
jgi:hypothetical protein